MTHENRKTLTALAIASDALTLLLSLILGYVLRFHVLRGEADHAPLSYYLSAGLVIIPFFLLLYGLLGLYDGGRLRFQRELEKLTEANLIGAAVLMTFFFLVRSVDISRLALALFLVAATALTALGHSLRRRWERGRRLSGRGLTRVLLVGGGAAAESYRAAVRADRTLGIEVAGSADVSRLDAALAAGGIDEVVAALSEGESAQLPHIVSACERSGTRLALLPFYQEYLPSRPQLDEVGGLLVINMRAIPLDNLANAFIKRCEDILGAAALLILTSPVMLIAAVGTRLSGPGPVIFRQERVGRGKRVFTMYKFRSMRPDAAPGWTTADDPRRTAFGALLRKCSVDELPQLWNVLRGDMSLVGPRPETPRFVEQFRESVPLYMVKHQVRPGMTGWAQINGLRGDTSIPDRIRHDIWYIENWSPLLDARIILLTPFRGMINGEKLVRRHDKT